jgi:hypothetical protein
MLKKFDKEYHYKGKSPFPYYYQDDILDEEFARELQKEIIELPLEEFDRYNNPFEQKYTYRDKNRYPKKLKELMEYLTCEEFVTYLSEYTGYTLCLDTTKNFYGVHVYNPGDKLDIHVDAGVHPTLNLKKQVTLGIYLSYHWKKENGCALEIWEGDNCTCEMPKLYQCVDKIHPMFNRLILFTNTDNAWHGNPDSVVKLSEDNRGPKRIFITLSYLSHPGADSRTDNMNKKKKAYFIARPGDQLDVKKDMLRKLRADPDKCNEVYRVSGMN